MSDLLFEVWSHATEVYATAVAVVLTVAMAACRYPARRDARRPNIVLRQE